MTTNTAKEAYVQELKELMESWNRLDSMPSATERDYKRYKDRIQEVCRALDEIDRQEAGR